MTTSELPSVFVLSCAFAFSIEVARATFRYYQASSARSCYVLCPVDIGQSQTVGLCGRAALCAMSKTASAPGGHSQAVSACADH